MHNPFVVNCESRPSIGSPIYSYPPNAGMAPSLVEGGLRWRSVKEPVVSDFAPSPVGSFISCVVVVRAVLVIE